ncbi:PEGA domain-containing protein [Sorangium sp. So ce1151]|uniref:PEGA domain-containing protein n=1 Tax=Sorangium sp. So ce1151 TaxID=3133332 RepID=UPI003F617802
MRRELHAGWLAMSLVLASAAATTSARGEERAKPGPSEESERDRAVRDFEQGRRAHVAGRLEEAEFFYLRAWARMKSYDIATNLGQVQLQLNKPASAAKYLAFGVRTVGPEIEPERLARMQALLAEAKAQVGTLRVRVTNVRDAEVLVDGQRVPAEEMKHGLHVEPGHHVLVIRRAGYEEAAIQVAAVAGSHEEIATELKPRGATRIGATGARVLGDAKTKAPAAGARMEAPRSWVPAIALGAASAVGLGVAVGFTVASNKASADMRAQRAALWQTGGACVDAPDDHAIACRELRRTAARVDVHANAARLAYLTSGALAIAALTYAIWPGGRPARAVSLEAGPGLDAGGASIAVVGSW